MKPRDARLEAMSKARRISREKQTTRHVVVEAGEYFVCSDATADAVQYAPQQFVATFHWGEYQDNDC